MNCHMPRALTRESAVDLKAIEDPCTKLEPVIVNSLKCIHDYLQVELSFAFGLIENEIQNDTQFES